MELAKTNRTNWVLEFSNKRFIAGLSGMSFSPHIREYHCLVLVEQGFVKVCSEADSVVLQQGQSIIIPSGKLISFSTEGSPCRAKFHYIEPDELLFANSGILPNFNDLKDTLGRCSTMATMIFADMDEPLTEDFYTEALGSLSERYWQGKIRPALADKGFLVSVQKAKRYVANNFKQKIALDEVSEISGLDRWRLTKRFKQVFGLTLFQYLHACRVSEAKRLLAMGYPIPEVSFECMFADQSHLNRLFRKYVGITPKTWIALTGTKPNQRFERAS